MKKRHFKHTLKRNIYKEYYPIKSMVKEELNENDKKLLEFCKDDEKSVGEIARYLQIAPANVTARLSKLEGFNLIRVNRAIKRGKKTFVRTIAGDKTLQYFIEILEEIEKRGGEINQDEYLKLLPFSFKNPADRDKFHAPLQLMFTKYIGKKLFITSEGKKFLEEHKQHE